MLACIMDDVVDTIPKFRLGERVRIRDCHSATDRRGKEGTGGDINVVISGDGFTDLYRPPAHLGAFGARPLSRP